MSLISTFALARGPAANVHLKIIALWIHVQPQLLLLFVVNTILFVIPCLPCVLQDNETCVQGELMSHDLLSVTTYMNILTYLLALAHALGDPRLNLTPGLVNRKEASFSSALDQLVGLHDKRRTREPRVVLLDFGEASFSALLKHFSLNL